MQRGILRAADQRFAGEMAPLTEIEDGLVHGMQPAFSIRRRSARLCGLASRGDLLF